MSRKNIIFFMPFIGGGGVEKNLFLIANFFPKNQKKLKSAHIQIDIKKNLIKKLNF